MLVIVSNWCPNEYIHCLQVLVSIVEIEDAQDNEPNLYTSPMGYQLQSSADQIYLLVR